MKMVGAGKACYSGSMLVVWSWGILFVRECREKLCENFFLRGVRRENRTNSLL